MALNSWMASGRGPDRGASVLDIESVVRPDATPVEHHTQYSQVGSRLHCWLLARDADPTARSPSSDLSTPGHHDRVVWEASRGFAGCLHQLVPYPAPGRNREAGVYTLQWIEGHPRQKPHRPVGTSTLSQTPANQVDHGPIHQR